MALVIYEWHIEQKYKIKENGLKAFYYIVTNLETQEKKEMESQEFWTWANKNHLQITPMNQF